MCTKPISLRERKKARTRRALVEAALRLFAERGFEATTVAEIAEAADVSPRTFFTYFPAKEDVLFADAQDRIDRLQDALAKRAPDESLLDALRRAAREVLADPTFRAEAQRTHMQVNDPGWRGSNVSLRGGFRGAGRGGGVVVWVVRRPVGQGGGLGWLVVRHVSARWVAQPRRLARPRPKGLGRRRGDGGWRTR